MPRHYRDYGIVNKNDHLFLHRLSTACERPIQLAPRSVPTRDLPLRAPLLLHRFLPSPLHQIFGPLRSRSAHMLCMRASHDENSAKTN